MTESPLVSVITIFLNERQFLQEAIESVIAQTTDRWELLLIDDGSSDGSAEIARRNEARDPTRIRYLSHDGCRNLGKSVSRNLGLREARGKYLTFLDGDDVFRPEKIERQAALLAAERVAMVYGRSVYWYSWSGAAAPSRPDTISRLGLASNRSYPPPDVLTQFLRDGGTVPCISGLTVRRRAALQVGGFDEQIDDLFEDQVFIAKICARFPVFVESGCWDMYRQHAASTSRQAIASGRYHPLRPNDSHRVFLSWLEGHLASTAVLDPELHEALAKASWPYRHPSLYAWGDGFRRLTKRASRTIKRLAGTSSAP